MAWPGHGRLASRMCVTFMVACFQFVKGRHFTFCRGRQAGRQVRHRQVWHVWLGKRRRLGGEFLACKQPVLRSVNGRW